MNKKLRLGISFSTAIMTALIAVTITNASTKTTKKTTKAKVTATAKAKAKKVVAKAKPKTALPIFNEWIKVGVTGCTILLMTAWRVLMIKKIDTTLFLLFIDHPH